MNEEYRTAAQAPAAAILPQQAGNEAILPALTSRLFASPCLIAQQRHIGTTACCLGALLLTATLVGDQAMLYVPL